MVSFTPRPLYLQEKDLWYPFNRRAESVRMLWRKEKSLPLLGILTLQLVTIPIELSWLLFKCKNDCK
jgi:hypothetical protein